MGPSGAGKSTLLNILDYWNEEYEASILWRSKASSPWKSGERSGCTISEFGYNFSSPTIWYMNFDGLWNIETPLLLSKMCLQVSVKKYHCQSDGSRFKYGLQKKIFFSSTFCWSAAGSWDAGAVAGKDREVCMADWAYRKFSIPVEAKELNGSVSQNFIRRRNQPIIQAKPWLEENADFWHPH